MRRLFETSGYQQGSVLKQNYSTQLLYFFSEELFYASVIQIGAFQSKTTWPALHASFYMAAFLAWIAKSLWNLTVSKLLAILHRNHPSRAHLISCWQSILDSLQFCCLCLCKRLNNTSNVGTTIFKRTAVLPWGTLPIRVETWSTNMHNLSS